MKTVKLDDVKEMLAAMVINEVIDHYAYEHISILLEGIAKDEEVRSQT